MFLELGVLGFLKLLNWTNIYKHGFFCVKNSQKILIKYRFLFPDKTEQAFFEWYPSIIMRNINGVPCLHKEDMEASRLIIFTYTYIRHAPKIAKLNL